MKQIILSREFSEDTSSLMACPMRLVAAWALYGIGVAALAPLAPPGAAGRAATWLIALLLGMWLAMRTEVY